MKENAKFVIVQLLRAYKWAISPLFPPSCRYVPTCSEYAMEAVDRYGALRGSLMAIARLLRCHPFVKGGYDPVLKASTSSSHSSVSPCVGGEDIPAAQQAGLVPDGMVR
ncbi:MAG: membrane protein insertion efficiency factor YidD [Acidobacteria bacterium]|nr:MAG: membrane protein insertion efficiency factor YidD [Acidobacteriota bacterium]